MTWLLFAAGGAFGAPVRYLLDVVISSRARSLLPVGTMTINIVGSGLLGALAATMSHTGDAYALLGVGFCGAFTTFSTYTWESLALAEDGVPRLAAVNLAVSLVGGLTAASLTYWLL